MVPSENINESNMTIIVVPLINSTMNKTTTKKAHDHVIKKEVVVNDNDFSEKQWPFFFRDVLSGFFFHSCSH